MAVLFETALVVCAVGWLVGAWLNKKGI